VPKGDAKIFEVLVRQMAKDGEVDIVVSKALGVLGHAELSEPISDLLHRDSALWDYGPSPARTNKPIGNVAHRKCVAAAGVHQERQQAKAPAKALTPMIAYAALLRFSTGETMWRREFIALAGASVAWPFAAGAQQAGRTYRLGRLLSTPRGSPANIAWFEKLRRHGFIEGQNLTIEYRAYAQHVDLIPQYAAELVNARADVIATAGEEAVRAVQQATKTIPIVAIVGDMLRSGLVNSLARPEGNTTGVSILNLEADGKRQDILIEAVPGLRLMAVLTDVNYTKYANLEALQEAARAHNIEFSINRVAKGEEIAASMDSAQASGATALNVISSPLFYAHRHLIMERAAAAHLPTIYEFPEVAEEGGFAAYGPRLLALNEVTARQVVQLFRGTKVADIPVEQPTKFELVINLKTAKAMGVTVPEALLVRADKIIE
jgi:putative tryptophan/tyrosine transport system substrate-binding protein